MTVVTSETNNSICLVTLDRADALNAFSSQMMDELADAFLDAAENEDAKVLVLTGAGRAFSAGADLKASGGSEAPKHGLEGLLNAIIDFPKPFIVAANGLGVGIGCTICGLSDMTFVAQSARFRCPFSALGLTAEASSTYTFTRLLGHQQASWLLLAAEWLSAEDSVKIGFALDIFPDVEFMPRVMEKASTLANLPLSSLLQTKELIMAPQRAAMKAAVVEENKGLAQLRGRTANIEAVTAFIEKRDPDFTGL